MLDTNITQGGIANDNGSIFERTLIPVLTGKGFAVFNYRDMNKPAIRESIANCQKYIIKNVPYTTIYNTSGRTEFVIVYGARNIRVEAKYQKVSGSVDEKFPYMLLNAIYSYPEKEVVFVVDGDGYKIGAWQWLNNQIINNWLNYKDTGKNIKLFKLIDYINWVNNNLPI